LQDAIGLNGRRVAAGNLIVGERVRSATLIRQFDPKIVAVFRDHTQPIKSHFQSRLRPKPTLLFFASAPYLSAGCAGVLMGHRMVQWYRSVSWCLERAAHYEQKAGRAADPAARQSFLEAAARWRQSAEIYQSMQWLRADPSNGSAASEQSDQRASLAQNVLSKLGNWSKWLRVNRAA
jgi:hypothetical protein